MSLPRWKRDQVITASDLNQLSMAIERLVFGDITGDSMVMKALASLRREDLVQCRIKKRFFHGDPIADDAEPAEVPSAWTYRYVGIGRAGIDVVGPPIYGRPVRNDECRIYPARVDMVCYCVRSPISAGEYAAELMLLPGSEVQAHRRCEAANSGSGGSGPGVIPPPPPLPLPESTGKGGGDSVAGGLTGASPGGGLSGGPGGLGGIGGSDELLPSS